MPTDKVVYTYARTAAARIPHPALREMMEALIEMDETTVTQAKILSDAIDQALKIAHTATDAPYFALSVIAELLANAQAESHLMGVQPRKMVHSD